MAPARIDERQLTVWAGDSHWPFTLDLRTGTAVLAIDGRTWRVRPQRWIEKRMLARFAYCGEEFVRAQLWSLCVQPETPPDPGDEGEAVLGLAAWLSGGGQGEAALPLDSVLLTRVTLTACRELGVPPSVLDDLPVYEVESLWRQVPRGLSAEDRSPTDQADAFTHKILIVPDLRPADAPASRITPDVPAERLTVSAAERVHPVGPVMASLPARLATGTRDRNASAGEDPDDDVKHGTDSQSPPPRPDRQPAVAPPEFPEALLARSAGLKCGATESVFSGRAGLKSGATESVFSGRAGLEPGATETALPHRAGLESHATETETWPAGRAELESGATETALPRRAGLESHATETGTWPAGRAGLESSAAETALPRRAGLESGATVTATLAESRRQPHVSRFRVVSGGAPPAATPGASPAASTVAQPLTLAVPGDVPGVRSREWWPADAAPPAGMTAPQAFQPFGRRAGDVEPASTPPRDSAAHAGGPSFDDFADQFGERLEAAASELGLLRER